VIYTREEIIEEIISHFGRTGDKKRPRIRKFHAEILYHKFLNKEKILSRNELNRPQDYILRMVKYSNGWLEFANEEEGEMFITEKFFGDVVKWFSKYCSTEILDEDDSVLAEKGIVLKDGDIYFTQELTYSKFHKLVSDETEAMNNPRNWKFSNENLETQDFLDFNQKDSHVFASKLFILKMYILRKIDEVAFVTSRFVRCPKCGANYTVASEKIDFQSTYKCENLVGDKECGTTLKKFPARKMIPTFIYEVAVEIKSGDNIEFKEFSLESFKELHPGFWSVTVFGRTEAKTNSFYFTGLTAKEERGVLQFKILNNNNQHKLLDVIDSVINHVQNVGFIIDPQKARLPVIIETIKKINLIINKEINLDHSLYFGAPGIGKTYSLTLFTHMFYSNSGMISGPRFSLAGLTGGQKEVYYQDTVKKKNVPGLFSMSAFIFDEINNLNFIKDSAAVNLFKSVALAPSGTSTTVGGKEFPRTSLIAGTANYDVDYLKHYENKIKRLYRKSIEKKDTIEQSTFLELDDKSDELLMDSVDFYCPLKDYKIDTPLALKTAILKVRDEPINYLTNFEKPLMERFYWTVLVHPKYDKTFLKQKKINVEDMLKSRKSIYSARELISQLYTPNFDTVILDLVESTKQQFEDPSIEYTWSKEVQDFLSLMANKYLEFFSMFSRIPQVHVFTLYSLSLINRETHLSHSTKRIFEKLISLLHTPISIDDFHHPDFDNFVYIGETKGEFLEILKRYPQEDIRRFIDYDNRETVRKMIDELLKAERINKIDDYHYEININKTFEEAK